MTAGERWDAKYADWQEPAAPSEFVTGCAELEPISFEEGWFGQRHEARLVARRPS